MSAKFEVHAYYGTEEGRVHIDNFLKAHDIYHEHTSYTKKIQAKTGDIKDAAMKIWSGRLSITDDTYAVIREFNMTKINIFPDEMIIDAQKAITLFVKRVEKPVFINEKNRHFISMCG